MTLHLKLGFVVATLLVGAGVAQAVPIDLTLTAAAPKTLGPQSESAPCIIAGTQCQNPANFDFTNYVQGGGPSSDNNVDSPEYTIDQFPFLNFNVAIDVNTNVNASETLQAFSVFVDADGDGAGGFEEIYAFTGPALIGDASSAGNGFGDWLLGPVDLSSYADDALVFFTAVWDGAVAGAESFFLVDVNAPPPPIAEPGSLMLMGIGLLAIGLLRRRKTPDRR